MGDSIIPLRRTLFLVLVGVHLLVLVVDPEILAPVVAGSVYLPLALLHPLGLPVFGVAESGGWPPPSLFGWTVVLFLWAAIWWRIAFFIAYQVRKRRIEY